MSTLLLTFNQTASERMGTNTRIRVKTMKRAGVEYVALRPSYRVSGKNAMIRTNKADDGAFTAELPETVLNDESLALPALKSNGAQYLMDDVGYGWFLLKPDQELNEKKDAIITITKSRTKAAKAEDAAAKKEDSDASEKPTGDGGQEGGEAQE